MLRRLVELLDISIFSRIPERGKIDGIASKRLLHSVNMLLVVVDKHNGFEVRKGLVRGSSR